MVDGLKPDGGVLGGPAAVSDRPAAVSPFHELGARFAVPRPRPAPVEEARGAASAARTGADLVAPVAPPLRVRDGVVAVSGGRRPVGGPAPSAADWPVPTGQAGVGRPDRRVPGGGAVHDPGDAVAGVRRAVAAVSVLRDGEEKYHHADGSHRWSGGPDTPHGRDQYLAELREHLEQHRAHRPGPPADPPAARPDPSGM